jgi:hypothetical protein
MIGKDTLTILPCSNLTPTATTITELGAAFWNQQGVSMLFQGILMARTTAKHHI